MRRPQIRWRPQKGGEKSHARARAGVFQIDRGARRSWGGRRRLKENLSSNLGRTRRFWTWRRGRHPAKPTRKPPRVAQIIVEIARGLGNDAHSGACLNGTATNYAKRKRPAVKRDALLFA